MGACVGVVDARAVVAAVPQQSKAAADPPTRQLMMASERVRLARGLSIVVDRSQAPKGSEDVTIAVEREIGLETDRPSSSWSGRPDTQEARCAAVIDMKEALQRAKHEFAKQHVLDAPTASSKHAEEMIEPLLKIERDAIRREQRFVVIADAAWTLAVAATVPDVTRMLVLRFALRYAELETTAFSVETESRSAESDDGVEPCAVLVKRTCQNARPDPDACDAATRLVTRVSQAVCQRATDPIESVALAAKHTQDAALAAPADPCADMVAKLCTDHGQASAECKQAITTRKQLSAQGCALVLRRRVTSPSGGAPDANTDSTSIPSNPF